MRQRTISVTAFLLLIILFSLMTGCTYGESAKQIKAAEGKIDLLEGQIEGHAVKLDGEWEFYWKELLTPEDFRGIENKKTDYIEVPGSWNAYITRDGEDSGYGYATYRLIIFLSIWMNDYSLPLLQKIVKSDNLSAVGQLIFVFTNSVILAKQFSYSLEQEEKMTQELKSTNRNLDSLVKKRTEALEESKRKLQKANHALKQMAHKDPLTGLWNRRHYNETIDTEWRRCLRNKKPIALMFVDMDYFKKYNDCYGHAAGDECLKKIAQALQRLFRRASDVVIRFGGEEFVVLMPEINKDQAIRMADKVSKEIRELDIIHECSPISWVSVSIGVSSMVPERHQSFEELLLTADKALYLAKNSGRKQVKYLP